MKPDSPQVANETSPAVQVAVGAPHPLRVLSPRALRDPCGGQGVDADGVIVANGPEGPVGSLCIHSSNAAVLFTRVDFSMTISYNEHGRSDSASKSARSGQAQTVRLALDFSTTFQGGVSQIGLSYSLTNGQSGSKSFGGRITGENPTKDMVKNKCGSVPMAVLAYLLSGFRQFDAHGSAFVTKRLGQTCFGLLAIPSPTAAQIWNWKSNIERGEQLYQEAHTSALAYPQEMRDAGHKVDDFDRKQLALETYQRFGTSRSYWVPGVQGWIPSPAGGAFAEGCLKVEQDVRAGNPPAGWD